MSVIHAHLQLLLAAVIILSHGYLDNYLEEALVCWVVDITHTPPPEFAVKYAKYMLVMLVYHNLLVLSDQFICRQI